MSTQQYRDLVPKVDVFQPGDNYRERRGPWKQAGALLFGGFPSDAILGRRPIPEAVTPKPEPTQPVTATGLLQQAADTLNERGKEYDKPEGERSMAATVAAFNIITGQDMTEAQGWEFMSVLKKVRSWQRPGYHEDSHKDDIAYCALKAEAKAKI